MTMAEITNNFNLFDLSDDSVHDFDNSYRKAQKSPLNSVLKEVELNTPDSISIAVKILKQLNLEIPELSRLNDLQQYSDSVKRDVSFYDQSQKLKLAVIEKIRHIMIK